MSNKQTYYFESLSDNEQLHEAILLATEAHKGQLRKGSKLDYICHPMEVLQILTVMQADNPLLIAGVLHDVVEDTQISLEKIEELFGREVAELVAGHTEDKTQEWKVRKMDMMNRVRTGDRQLKMLVMADKVSNLRSIASDLRKIGDKVWERFSVPREMEFWYYTKMEEALLDLKEYAETAEIFSEMQTLHCQIFADLLEKEGKA